MRLLMHKFARSTFAIGIVFFLVNMAVNLAAEQAPQRLKTRNVVLIVSDGLSWQEVFTGADPTLLNSEHGGIWASQQRLRREYWKDSPDERRKMLFPFLWSVVAKQGQIFGNCSRTFSTNLAA